MCGIIGYVGTKEALPFLLDGLKELENRGYDSAGIVLADADFGTQLKRVVRTPGQSVVDDLRAGWNESDMKQRLGIGHTRWATHGGVSVENAHPHTDCNNRVYVVHNGVIENYDALSRQAKDRGHVLKTDVDTEIVAHLVEDALKRNKLPEAVAEILPLIEGTFGLVIVDAENSQQLVIARRSSPVYIGLTPHGYMVSSEQAGFPHETVRAVDLNDNEMAVLTPTDYRIFTLDGSRVDRLPTSIEWDVQDDDVIVGDVTRKEILEGPSAIANTLRGRLIPSRDDVKLGGLESVNGRLREIKRFHLVACGTAYYAGLIGAEMLEEYARVSAKASIASEFGYRSHLQVDANTAVIAISQSGETADTRNALAEAKRRGALTLGIVNVVGSSMSRETDAGVYTHAGRERGVASTKAFISQLSVLAMLAVYVGREGRMALHDASALVAALRILPEQLQEVLKLEDQVRKVAERLAQSRGIMFIGRRYSYPIALEGALKMKELSYIMSEAVPAGELKHGHLALVDEQTPTIAIVPHDRVFEKTLTSLQEIRARRGPVIAITTRQDNRLLEIAEHVFSVPETHEALQPVLTGSLLHLLAYHTAKVLGRDVDRPRNLAKAVTVE